MITDLFKLQRFKVATVAVLATFLINILVTATKIGGDHFVTIISNLIPVIFCLLASLLFASAWINAGNSVSKRIWGAMSLGLSFWTIAEMIWGYYAIIRNWEGSYPMVADLFWLMGYLLVYVGFITQYQSLYSPPSSLQRNLLVLVSVIFITVTFYFIAWPRIADFDSSNAWESLVSIIYPLADFGLLILSGLVLFSLEKGKYSSSVQLILLGFLSMAISDLGYSYTDWNGIYYPGGLINIPSFLVDTFYNISYMAIALGIFAYTLIPKTQKRIGLTLEQAPMPKQNILVFIDKHSRIIRTSENISILVNSQFKRSTDRMLLSEALGVLTEEVSQLTNTLATKGFVSNIQLCGAFDHGNDVWVSGVAWEQTGKFTGATLVFQTLPGAEHQNLIPLNPEQAMLVEHALSVCGTQEKEDVHALRTYFIEHINLLHSLIDQFSGARIANGLIEQINRRSARDHWRLVMAEGKITISDEYGSRDLGIYFSELLKVARSYALNYVGANVIEEEKRRLDAHLGKDVQKSVDKFIIRDNF